MNNTIPDLEHLRTDFPFLNLDSNTMIYLDNASTTQKPRRVIDKIAHSYSYGYASVNRADYKLADQIQSAYENARHVVKEFIGAEDIGEVIFPSGATESINIIAYNLIDILSDGDNIILTSLEHNANILPWIEISKRKNIKIKFIGVDQLGHLDELDLYLDQRTKIVSMIHCSNSLGILNPIKKMISTIKQYNPDIIVVVDGAQSITHVPIVVKDLGCDFFVFSGHKLYGPNGIGVLYVLTCKQYLLKRFKSGGGMINRVEELYSNGMGSIIQRLETGTLNAVGALGMAEGITYINHITIKRLSLWYHALYLELESVLTSNFQDIKIVSVRPGPILSFYFSEFHSYDLGLLLSRENICVRTGQLCNHFLLNHLSLPNLIRVSFAVYNSRVELYSLVRSIHNAIKKIRQS